MPQGTGESTGVPPQGGGVFVRAGQWNFPLAIFAGPEATTVGGNAALPAME